MKLIILFSYFFTSVYCYAETAKNTVPFVFESVKILDIRQATKQNETSGSSIFTTKGNQTLVNTTSSTQVEASKIGQVVRSVRDEVCKGIEKGSFKVWLKFDANAKVLGVGTSSEGGIEVNVICS